MWVTDAGGAAMRAAEQRSDAAIAGGGRPRRATDDGGAAAWLAAVERILADGQPIHRSKHAATYRGAIGAMTVFVKRYHRYRLRTAVKDTLRASKARAVLAASAALADAGFVVPRVLAAGEARRGLVLRDAWVVTTALEGAPVASRLADAGGDARARLRAKRRLLAAVGATVGRLHTAGFVAGDLVPPNVWVVADDGDAPAIALLDHDRTRAGRAPAPWTRARRNLVQLNRLVLPGVVATDRLRVYRAYVAARGLDAATARRYLDWVIAKTIERRRRFDGVADARTRGFRRLMRADAPRAGARVGTHGAVSAEPPRRTRR